MAELPRCSRKLRWEWRHLQNSRPGHRASAYQGHTYTAFAIAFLTVLFCSKVMAGPTQKWPALSDITNTGTLIDYTMQKLTSTYMPSSLPTVQTDALDEDERKRLQRNARRVKRRAEMTDEQRQEINRKQREYRARKKAESSYAPTAVQTPSSMAGL